MNNNIELNNLNPGDLVEYYVRPEETYIIECLDIEKDYMRIVNIDDQSVNQSVTFLGIDPNHIKLKGV